MRYRKRPIVVEAVPYEPGMEDAFLLTFNNIVVEKGDPRLCFQHVPIIKTLEGPHIISPGDWIITGVKGERYCCKPDVFALTYEPVDSASDVPRPEVLWLAQEMERRLRVNDHKGGWKACWDDFLEAKLDEEVGELKQALEIVREDIAYQMTHFGERGDRGGLAGYLEAVIHEAADVANVALMIADNARREGEKA